MNVADYLRALGVADNEDLLLAIAAVFQRGLQALGIDRDLHAGTFLLQKHGGR